MDVVVVSGLVLREMGEEEHPELRDASLLNGVVLRFGPFACGELVSGVLLAKKHSCGSSTEESLPFLSPGSGDRFSGPCSESISTRRLLNWRH